MPKPDEKKKKTGPIDKLILMFGKSSITNKIKPEGDEDEKDKKKLTPRQKALREAMKL